MTATEQPAVTGDTSDGHHTFNELYEHRCMLFIALMLSHPFVAWRSRLYADGSGSDGWWIGGMDLPTGAITYHLPDSAWALLDGSRVPTLARAPAWGWHTSADVEARLREWVEGLPQHSALAWYRAGVDVERRRPETRTTALTGVQAAAPGSAAEGDDKPGGKAAFVEYFERLAHEGGPPRRRRGP